MRRKCKSISPSGARCQRFSRHKGDHWSVTKGQDREYKVIWPKRR